MARHRHSDLPVLRGAKLAAHNRKKRQERRNAIPQEVKNWFERVLKRMTPEQIKNRRDRDKAFRERYWQHWREWRDYLTAKEARRLGRAEFTEWDAWCEDQAARELAKMTEEEVHEMLWGDTEVQCGTFVMETWDAWEAARKQYPQLIPSPNDGNPAN